MVGYRSHSAVSVVNAIATWRGAALGVDLWAEAEAVVLSEPRIEGEVLGDPSVDTILIEKAALIVLKRFNLMEEVGVRVVTRSNIPVARGLKSSSAAANAVVLAVTGALDEEIDDLEAVNLGVDACVDARVTITGAFDDACTSFFGGLVVTDNREREILLREMFSEDFEVLLKIPSKKVKTVDTKEKPLWVFKDLFLQAHGFALKGRVWEAITLNGLLCAVVYGLDTRFIVDALAAGALAAGVSGTGPTMFAVTPLGEGDAIIDVLERFSGETLRVKINNVKAGRFL
ncbi:MAG: shikimate kinase [Candidatus Wukongarchaeota archaeon]|nr:shikimate kinase [Candidatus Wukongarchaeota archaeon]